MNKDSELGRKLMKRYTTPLPSASIKSHLTTKNPTMTKATESPLSSGQNFFKTHYFDQLTRGFYDAIINVTDNYVLPLIKFIEEESEQRMIESKAVDVLVKYHWGYTDCLPFDILQEIISIEEDPMLGENSKQKKINNCLVSVFDFSTKSGIESHRSFSYSRDCLDNNLGKGWDVITNELYSHITYQRKFSAIPLLFIMMERLMVNLHDTHLDAKPGKVRRLFNEKIENENQNIEYLMEYAKYAKIYEGVIDAKIFTRAEHHSPPEGILNRHLVIHGKSDPTIWTEVDMYKLLTVLFGMAETIEAYKFITSEIEVENEYQNE